MKLFIKLFAIFATTVFVLVTVIKYVRGCTYKEAVGIVEELFKEMIDTCCCCEPDEDGETAKQCC